ncbi:response regulator transcription factor [Rhizocola hellebori]|nr:LuxR C-terminal-related transcriptional regulator [Rhizocola hellebori]
MAAVPMTVAVHSARRLVSEALSWCLATQPGLSVVGHTQQWAQLASLCRLRQPDTAVVDASADLDGTIGQLRWMTARSSVNSIVILCDDLPGDDVTQDNRGWRYFPHSRGLSGLLALLNDCSSRCETSRAVARSARLTEREVEVLAMVGSGLTAPEIADRLDIAPRSVENHKRRIYAKLGTHSQAAAVGAIAPLGILDARPNSVADSRLAAIPGLSRREYEILKLSSHGSSVRQMATTFGVAPKTVEAQLSLLYRKLNVHNRAQALAVARAHGLIPEGQ